MNFNNMDEVVNYIKRLCSQNMNTTGEKMKDIMREEIYKQIYDDHSPEEYERHYENGGLANSPQAKIGADYVNAEFADNGVWESWQGDAFFPMKAWDYWGTVIRSNKQGGGHYPKTNIVEESYNRCCEEIPIKFKEYLISKGLDVK